MVSMHCIPKKSILLNIPNIIIYIRFIFLVFAMIMWFKSAMITFLLYFISANLDAFDGYFARKLNQTSKTGAIFDLCLDRISTAFILLGLAMLYPLFWWFFCGILMLDISSHFAHLYYCALNRNENHKTMETSNKLFKSYYSNKPFLFFCCFTHDMWLATVYLYHSYPSNFLIFGMILFTPGFIIKNYIHFIQFWSAIKYSLKLDEG